MSGYEKAIKECLKPTARCAAHVSVSHGGINDVKKHGEGKKHKDLFRAKSQGNKMTSFFTSSKESDLDQSVIMAETLFSVMLAEK